MFVLFGRLLNITGKDFKFSVFAVLAMSILSGILEVVGVSLIFPLLALMNSSEYINEIWILIKVKEITGIEGFEPFLMLLTLAISFVFIFKSFFMIFYHNYQLNMIKEWRVNLSNELMARYLSVGYDFHLSRSAATNITYLTHTISFVMGTFVVNFLILISNSIVTLFLIGILLYQFLAPAIFAIGVVSLFALFHYFYVKKRALAISGKIQTYNASYISVIKKSLDSIKETKSYLAEKAFLSEYSNSNHKIANLDKQLQFINVVPTYLSEATLVVAFLGMASIIFVSGQNFFGSALSLAVVAAVSFRMAPLVTRSIFSFSQVKASSISVSELLAEVELLRDLEQENIEEELEELRFEKSLKLKDLSYCYPTMKSMALENICLSLNKNSFIGIVGKSGAGKSTLTDVLMGLLSITSGSIYLDDEAIVIKKQFECLNLAW